MSNMKWAQANIANGASLSQAINIEHGHAPVAIEMPAAWTAANLTFSGAESESGTFKDLYDQSGGEVTVVAAQGRYILLNPASFVGIRWLKVRSGTSAAAVNQGAARVVSVGTREV